MFGTGVASFGHVHGVHLQNVDSWEQYVGLLDKGELPLGRALPVTPRPASDPRNDPAAENRALRRPATSRASSASNILEAFADGFQQLADKGS